MLLDILLFSVSVESLFVVSEFFVSEIFFFFAEESLLLLRNASTMKRGKKWPPNLSASDGKGSHAGRRS